MRRSPLFAASIPEDFVISDPAQAINVLEFEAAAQKALPPAHWGYLSTGVDDDATLKANREGFSHYQLRPRRLVDTTKIDMSVDLFGTKWETPIVLAPSGTLFHPEGAAGGARGAEAEDAADPRRRPGEKPSHRRSDEGSRRAGVVSALRLAGLERDAQTVKRIESAGCPVLVWTVDILGGRNLETVQRLRRLDTRQCMSCHTTDPQVRPGRPAGTR